MRLLYVDCIGGVAGDMLLAALLDAGADPEVVRRGLAGLGVEGLELRTGRAERHGISALTVEVAAPHEHVHRTWADVRSILDRAALPEAVAAVAHDAFRRLAEAEGKVHRMPPDEVVFHEVGAVDAIGDVCGVALALDDLAADRVECSPLPASRGFVRAAHGRLPLPAPAVLELLAGTPLVALEVDRELVTPTGAALVTTIAESFGPFPAMTLHRVGYGAGSRELEQVPNIVRVVLGEAAAEPAIRHEVAVVETNLDDCPPELVPDAIERCLAVGALDVWATPATMKKGRPGLVLAALVRPGDVDAVAAVILRETTALGVRISYRTRIELERDWETVHVDGHEVRVKLGYLDGTVVNAAPEHDDCAAVARATGRSVKSVWAQALGAVGVEGAR